MTRRLGWGCLAAVVVLLALQPLVAPYDPRGVDLAHALERPSKAHPLGTDGLGRDVMARVAAGAWSSILVGLVAIAVSSLVGVGVGILAGAGGARVDGALSVLVDVLLAFPRFVLLLNVAAVVTFRSAAVVGMVIGAMSWMRTARLVRTEVLTLRERTYVEAARAAGARGARVLAKHLGPHVSRLVVETAALRFSSVVVAASTLDFLGMGLPSESPTWGRLILDGQSYLETAPWVTLSAVLALGLTAVGLTLASERRPGDSRRILRRIPSENAP